MSNLIFRLILAFLSLGVAPVFAAPPTACELRLQNGIGINLERALDRDIIKLRDVKRMIESAERFDPFAKLTPEVENSHLQEFFAAVIQHVPWETVRAEAAKVYQKRTGQSEIEEAAREVTAGVLKPDLLQSFELPNKSPLHWGVGSDGVVYFYSEWVKEVYRLTKTGYESVFKFPEGIDGGQMLLREGRPVAQGFKIVQVPGGWRNFFQSQARYVMVEYDILSGRATDVSRPFAEDREKKYHLDRMKWDLRHKEAKLQSERFEAARNRVPNLQRREDYWLWLSGVADRHVEMWADEEGHALMAVDSDLRTWGKRSFVLFDYSREEPLVNRVVYSTGRLGLKFFNILGTVYLWAEAARGESEVLMPLDRDTTPIELDLARFKDDYFEVVVGRDQVFLIGRQEKRINVLRLFGSSRGEP